MAAVTCGKCGAAAPDGQVFCLSCGQPVGGAPAPPPRPATAPTEVLATAAARCAVPGCGGELLEGEERCSYCGTPVGDAATARALVFPWGTHALRDGESVELGRQQPPFATQLAGYSNVSKIHARATRVRDTLLVVDLGSLNGTFVDGRRLAPNTPTELRPGQVLRLAATLEVEVR